MSAALELDGLCAAYGAHRVLSDVSCALREGERAVLLGPNGAGKTTLLRTLTGLHPPSGGGIRLFGRNAAELTPADRASLVAVVPQELLAPMPFTVDEIVLMGRTATLPRWRHPGPDDRHAAERAMAFMDVLELQDRTFDALSGGERQRAVIAMALAREPRLLLLDEPTSHLDVHHRFEILRLLERLHRERGLTVLMSSHDLDLAARYGERVLLLDHGRLAADGPPREVLREDRLQAVYRCDLRVEVDASGVPMVRPPPETPTADRPDRAPVFVIAGGGSGMEALRTLALAGIPVRCGVLNEGDSDARTAAALGVDCVLERPFSALSDAALDRARAWAASSSAVVLCETAFGAGNVANLELALEAQRNGVPIWVHGSDAAERDFTPGAEAGRLIVTLRAGGARTWRRADELLAL